jgi:hypothetical protein
MMLGAYSTQDKTIARYNQNRNLNHNDAAWQSLKTNTRKLEGFSLVLKESIGLCICDDTWDFVLAKTS